MSDMTVKEHIDCAIEIITNVRAFAQNEVEHKGGRELAIAVTKLEESQMWYTRGIAKEKGLFHPADLDRLEGNGDD